MSPREVIIFCSTSGLTANVNFFLPMLYSVNDIINKFDDVRLEAKAKIAFLSFHKIYK